MASSALPDTPKILYFGQFDPEYSRNRVLIKGLKQNDFNVDRLFVSPKDPLRYLKLFFRYFFQKKDFIAAIVGFPGQEMMFLAKLLIRKPIILDVFTSHYGGYILDRQYFSPKSWRAKYYRFLDKYSCRLADAVLLDTNEHINFFIREYGLKREKFHRIFVGADSGVFRPTPAGQEKSQFIVHFHGGYSPMQGVATIIKAAKILENENIVFNLIGNGQTYRNDRETAEKNNAKNIRFIDRLPYAKLAEQMSRADVCLGIFGQSPKTALVIPNKVYEALAAAKPVITADTPAAKELLTDKENVMFCRAGDCEDLAAKISELRDNAELKNKIAAGGFKLFTRRLTEDILGRELAGIINSLKRNK